MLIGHRHWLPGADKLFCPATHVSLSCSQEAAGSVQQSIVSHRTLNCCQSGGVGHAGTVTPLHFHSLPEHNNGSRSLPDGRIKLARRDRTAQMQRTGLVGSRAHTFAGLELYHTWRETGTLQCNSSQPKKHPKNDFQKNACFSPSFIKGAEYLQNGDSVRWGYLGKKEA